MPENRIPNAHLSSGPVLARNTAWNLLGFLAPMVVAAFAIPPLIHALGKDRFGVLALGWAVVGYFGLFDFGLGRAVTQLVAEKLGRARDREIPGLFWTALLLMSAIALVGMAVFLAVSPWLVHRVLKIPTAIQGETIQAFYLLAISVPIVVSTTGLRGLLEAYQRFDLTTAIRIPLGIAMFAGPVLVLPFSTSLVPVTAALVLARALGWIAHFFLCARAIPEVVGKRNLDLHLAGPLLRFGGWISVSNLISPIMVSMDRFFIGSVLSVAAVAYYATPHEVVTKLLFVPGAIVGVLFPAFSTSFVQDPERTSGLFRRTVKLTFLIVFPVALAIVLFAREGLQWWLGASFASNGFRVTQWLAVGVLLNSLALAPFTLIQGVGRPDLTAKLHMIELPLYLGALLGLIHFCGIVGAAIAWAGRVGLDSLLLFGASARFLPGGRAMFFRMFAVMLAAVAVLSVAFLHLPLMLKIAELPVIFVTFCALAWYRILDPSERRLALMHLRNLPASN